jgi:uncharacterized protein (TIGR03437 family)
MLRLSNSVVGPVTVAVGAAAPAQTLEASNAGDGALSLSLTVGPGASWLTASVGASGACATPGLQPPCYPLQFQLNTTGLAEGTYTAEVTVSDRHAVDAPQVVTVTVRVGAPEPASVDRYMAAGTTYDTALFPGDGTMCFVGLRQCPSPSASTQDGGDWLSIVVYEPGTIRFYGSYMIHLAPPAGMAPGTYHGTVSAGSPAPARTIPVTMRVTTLPIGAPSASEMHVRVAQGGPAVTYPFLPYLALANTGAGTLAVSDVTGSGAGVAAYDYQGLGIATVDPAGLGPGRYSDGSVTFECNAVNCPLSVPVRVDVVPPAAPVIAYQGVMDNASYGGGLPVAPGDVVVAKGEQLSMHAPDIAAGAPLPSVLGGASVLVNGVRAPMYYASSGQVAFQMPSSTAAGTALVQVVRDGQPGNTVSVGVKARAPRVIAVTDAAYNRLDLQHPATAGDFIIVWAIGLGPTNPPIPDGTIPGAPTNLTETPTVGFYGTNLQRSVAPIYAGLSGGAVGLYQVNAVVPQDAPPGSLLVHLHFPDADSDSATIAVR